MSSPVCLANRAVIASSGPGPYSFVCSAVSSCQMTSLRALYLGHAWRNCTVVWLSRPQARAENVFVFDTNNMSYKCPSKLVHLCQDVVAMTCSSLFDVSFVLHELVHIF
jgi:hypothetical protein